MKINWINPWESLNGIEAFGVHYYLNKDIKAIIFNPNKNIIQIKIKLMNLDVKISNVKKIYRKRENQGTYNTTNGRILHCHTRFKTISKKEFFGF